MSGSPKGGFPARRPGKLFGKKQMVMFGCIVLVLFVAPSLFGIGDTTDAHRIDPDDRGLVRTDFDGDRHRRRHLETQVGIQTKEVCLVFVIPITRPGPI